MQPTTPRLTLQTTSNSPKAAEITEGLFGAGNLDSKIEAVLKKPNPTEEELCSVMNELNMMLQQSSLHPQFGALEEKLSQVTDNVVTKVVRREVLSVDDILGEIGRRAATDPILPELDAKLRKRLDSEINDALANHPVTLTRLLFLKNLIPDGHPRLQELKAKISVLRLQEIKAKIAELERNLRNP